MNTITLRSVRELEGPKMSIQEDMSEVEGKDDAKK